MDVLVIISLLAVMVTKLFDVISSTRVISEIGERHPEAESVIHRVIRVGWTCFSMVVLLAVIVGVIVLYLDALFLKIVCCVVAFLVAIAQLGNSLEKCGYPNFISRCAKFLRR